jgi:heat shock protein HslJ
MQRIILSCTLFSILVFFSCARLNSVSSDTSTDLTPKDETSKPANIQLINSRCVLRELNGKAVKPSSDVYVRFVDEITMEGFGGCNKFNGKYATDGADIKIGPLMSTKMSCDELSIENQFTFILERTTSYNTDAKYLYLKNEDGVLAKLEAIHL